MSILISTLLISSIISFSTVPLIKKLATIVGAIDKPGSPLKIHTRSIPRIGGLAIFFGFLMATLFAVFFANPIRGELKGQILALLIGAAMVLGLGVIDDIKGVHHYHRFAVEIPVALMLVLFGLKINTPAFLPLGIALTIFYVVATCNSVNLLDGIDGLTAGATAIACLAFCIAFLKQGESLGLILSIALLGSTLGFLWHNFNPASIFMGDSGSAFLGYSLAVLAIIYLRDLNSISAFFVPLGILGLPIFDTSLTLLRRALNHKPLLQADRGHFYDKLIRKGLNQRQAALTAYGMGTIFAITGILFIIATPIPILMVVAGEFIGLAIMVLKFDMLS